jgi:hypothetical protein
MGCVVACTCSWHRSLRGAIEEKHVEALPTPRGHAAARSGRSPRPSPPPLGSTLAEVIKSWEDGQGVAAGTAPLPPPPPAPPSPPPPPPPPPPIASHFGSVGLTPNWIGGRFAQ